MVFPRRLITTRDDDVSFCCQRVRVLLVGACLSNVPVLVGSVVLACCLSDGNCALEVVTKHEPEAQASHHRPRYELIGATNKAF